MRWPGRVGLQLLQLLLLLLLLQAVESLKITAGVIFSLLPQHGQGAQSATPVEACSEGERRESAQSGGERKGR